MKCFALAAVVLAAPVATAQTYSVTPVDLGTDSVASWATDVTDDGRVAGVASVEGGRRTFGFIWRDGVVVQLVVPQAGNFGSRPRSLDIHHHVEVLALTEGGYYAGTGSNTNFGFSLQPFFAWLPTSDPYPAEFLAAEDLGSAIVHDIADSTPFITAVGAGSLTGNRRVGFISQISRTDDVGDPPRVTFLYGFGGTSSPAAAWGVNNSGDVVGFAAGSNGVHRAFVRPASSGLMTDLGTLGGPSAEAFDIGDTGFIVGHADTAPGRPHAFVRPPGATSLTDLGTLGGSASAARAVNDAGVVVGESWTSGGIVHAFVWQAGQMTDLNTRIPPGSGWTLTHASAINNSGAIVGWGRFQGKTRGFMLVPGPVCRADFDGNGQLDFFDYLDFVQAFGEGRPDADFDANGQVDFFDYLDFVAAFDAGCD
jgi:probable HAF family extracellular repeat protein